jgi:hypothetical protein
MTTIHPGRFELERLWAEDLQPAERAAAARHVADCDRCAAYVAELGADATARLAAVPATEFSARLAARRGRRPGSRGGRRAVRLAAFASVMAAAAGWALLARDTGPTATSDGVRFKGAGLAVHVRRGDRTSILSSHDRIRAGDGLRIVVTLPARAPVAVWFVDEAGQVDALLDGESTTLERGEHALPGSATVESPCRDLLAVVAIGDAAARATEQELRAAAPAGEAALEAAVPPGALTRRLRCE